MILENGSWFPDVFSKQAEVLNLCQQKTGRRKYILLSGPRWTGKTVAALNAVVDHAWNTKHAAISILCTSIQAGSDSGVWSLLIDKIIPLWIEGNFGLDWDGKPGARQHHVSKKYYCLLKNKHGGTSKIQLDSLKQEREVENDFKNRYLTMLYWSEVSSYKQAKTYHTLIQALRSLGTSEDEFILLGDTNPADDGEDSWIYKEWFEFRRMDPQKLPEIERARQKCLHLLEWTPDDNPYLTPEFKMQKAAEFSADPDLYARYWEGKWKKSSTDALFVMNFRRSIHVEASTGPANDPEICVPEEGCTELSVGWDIGEANHAVEFSERVLMEAGEKLVPGFKFFDEIVILGGIVSIEELTIMALEKMDKWEEFLGREIVWKHWSDRSSLDQRQSISKRFPYEEVLDASDGEIRLTGVDNTRGSLAPSVRQWRKMLHQGRLIFSDQCPRLVEVNTSLKCKNHIPDTVAESVHKHPFDAARYIIMAELWEEMLNSIVNTSRRNRFSRYKRRPSATVSIPL